MKFIEQVDLLAQDLDREYDLVPGPDQYFHYQDPDHPQVCSEFTFICFTLSLHCRWFSCTTIPDITFIYQMLSFAKRKGIAFSGFFRIDFRKGKRTIVLVL